MSTKREVVEQLARGEGCLGKADDDEPIFVLRAQDVFAPSLVESWAMRVRRLDPDAEKSRSAYKVADAMLKWQANHKTKVPD